MSNPLLNMLTGGSNNNFLSKISPMIGLLKGDTNAAIKGLLNSNPEAKRAWDSVQQMTKGKSNKEIEKIAEDLAKQNGISLNELKALLKK